MLERLFPALLVLVAAAIAYAIYDEVTAEHFTLRKDQWSCTASHIETTTTHMQVGNVSVPQFHTNQVCDQWTRR